MHLRHMVRSLPSSHPYPPPSFPLIAVAAETLPPYLNVKREKKTLTHRQAPAHRSVEYLATSSRASWRRTLRGVGYSVPSPTSRVLSPLRAFSSSRRR